MDNKTKEFHKHLVKRLSSSDLDKSLLKSSTDSIAASFGKGIKWDDVFPLGIKLPDGIEVVGKVSVNNVGRIKELLDNDLLTKIEIFPRGIVQPDFLEVRARFSQNRALNR